VEQLHRLLPELGTGRSADRTAQDHISSKTRVCSSGMMAEPV
jgi:hypothetical protein